MAIRICEVELHPVDQAERDSFHENHDCTVVAVAGAADIPYREAHALLAKAGRKPRHGFKFRTWLNNQCWGAHIKGEKFRLGAYTVTRIILPWYNKYNQGVTLAQFLRDFPRGRFLLRKSGHVFFVDDGKVLNLGSTGVRTRITNLWHLERV